MSKTKSPPLFQRSREGNITEHSALIELKPHAEDKTELINRSALKKANTLAKKAERVAGRTKAGVTRKEGGLLGDLLFLLILSLIAWSYFYFFRS